MKSLIINYKAYKEGIDACAEIALAAKKLSDDMGVKIIVAPPFSLLKETSGVCATIAQGLWPIEPGAFTGHVSWYEIKKSGAIGTLIKHSENRLSLDEIKSAVEICKRNGLFSYVCAKDMSEAKEVTAFSPYAIAYEPPELVGGDVSVSKAQPKIVKEFVDLVRKSCGAMPLIGAGVKTSEDVKKSVELGSEGILVASGIIKSENFEQAILNLAKPLSLGK